MTPDHESEGHAYPRDPGRRTRKSLVTIVGIPFVILMAAALFLPGLLPPPPLRLVGLHAIKRTATAVLIYAGDADDLLPLTRTPNGVSAMGWADRIAPNLTSKDDLRDEDDPGGTVSYGMNANAAELPRVTAATRPELSVLLFEIAGFPPHPSTPPLSPVGDGAIGGLIDARDPAQDPVVRYATGILTNSHLSSEGAWPRHDGKSDFAFLDGHARRRSPKGVVAGANALHPGDAASLGGCRRPDLPRRDRPCAEGTELAATGGVSRGTFSLR